MCCGVLAGRRAGCCTSRCRHKEHGSSPRRWAEAGGTTGALPMTTHTVPSRTAGGERVESDCQVAPWQFSSPPRPQKWWIEVFTEDSESRTEPARQLWVLGSWSASSPVASLLFPLGQRCDSCHFAAGVVLNLVIVMHTISIKFSTFLCSFTAAILFFFRTQDPARAPVLSWLCLWRFMVCFPHTHACFILRTNSLADGIFDPFCHSLGVYSETFHQDKILSAWIAQPDG